MFCPKCKSEYREGFEKCSDCYLELVKELPAEIKTYIDLEYIEYKFVLSTFNGKDIALIKSVFDNKRIIYFIQGEIAINTGGECVGPFRVLVKNDQVDLASGILKGMELEYIWSI